MSNRLRVFAVFALAAFAAGFPLEAGAQGTVYGSSLGFSFKAGYAFPSDSYQTGHIPAAGALLLRFSPVFILEVEAGVSAISVLSQPQGLSQGRLWHIPASVNLRLRLPLGGIPLSPYLTAGGGLAVNIHILDAVMVEGFRDLGFELEETCRPAFFGQFGAGIEIALGSNLALDLQGRYRLCRTTSKWSITDLDSRTTLRGTVEAVNLNAVQVLGGLRFLFQ